MSADSELKKILEWLNLYDGMYDQEIIDKYNEYSAPMEKMYASNDWVIKPFIEWLSGVKNYSADGAFNSTVEKEAVSSVVAKWRIYKKTSFCKCCNTWGHETLSVSFASDVSGVEVGVKVLKI